MKIEYHPFTVDDLISAEIHYDELQPGLSPDSPSQTSSGIRNW